MDVVKYFADNSMDFWLSVYLPVTLWLIIVFVFFVLLLRKYTFADWSEEKPNPFEGETFNMPRGIFRGILTLSLLFSVVVLELANVRIIGLEDELHEFMIAFQMMIAFYFGSKVMHHITSADKSKNATRYSTTTDYQTQNDTSSNETNSGAATSDFHNEEAMG